MAHIIKNRVEDLATSPTFETIRRGKIPPLYFIGFFSSFLNLNNSVFQSISALSANQSFDSYLLRCP
jgi:hypothetical protein